MDFYGFMIFSIFMVSDLWIKFNGFFLMKILWIQKKWIKMLTKRSKKIMEKAKNEELGVA